MKHNKRKKLTVFDKIILILNLIFSAALLLSYLAPGTDPRDYAFIAILGFGYQMLLLSNIAFIGYWVIRVRMYFLVSLICVLLGFHILILNFGLRSERPVYNNKEHPAAIRLMEYNVRGFVGIGKHDGYPIYNEILQVIKDKQPDIIAFAEYTLRPSDSVAMSDSVKKVLNTNYYYFKKYSLPNNDSSGVALFSRLPVINSGWIYSPEVLQTEAIFIDVKFEDKIFRVYCIHLAAVDINYFEKAKYLDGNLDLDKTSFIKSKLTAAFIARSHQVSFIKRNLDSCSSPYIIMGDFNDTPSSFAVNTLGEGLKNAFAEKGSGLGVTYYSKFPKLQIDYILVSPRFDVLNYEAVNKEISDHKPVISDLLFNGTP